MKFLYVGNDGTKADLLESVLSRVPVKWARTDTPEHAFFKVLHEDIRAVFLDLTNRTINGEEALANVSALERNVEVFLIASMDDINLFDTKKLRNCSGFITPDVDAPANTVLLYQLVEKLSLKQRLSDLQSSAILDGLTQLYNHAYFQQRLEEEVRLLKPGRDVLSLVMLDIDNFKHYNDTNGHPAGDRLLKKMAKLLGQAVRKFDLLARYGGEEFVLVLMGAGRGTALTITERIRKKIVTHEFEYGHLQPLGFVSASFGVAVLDRERTMSKDQLIANADRALYMAKDNGKNGIWCYSDGQFSAFP